MYFIFPSANLAKDLHDKTNIEIEPYQLRQLSFKGALEIVNAIVEEELTSKLNWTYRKRVTENVIGKHLDWWVDTNQPIMRKEQNAHFSDYFFNLIIDPLFDRISMMLLESLGVEGKNLWCLWHTHPLNNDLVIERGEDYRLVDYERRVLEGSIETSTKVRDKIRQENFRVGRSF